MILKERIPGFSELAECVKDYSLNLMATSYREGNCQLGNNGGTNSSERESLFMLKLDEFDDERIKIIQRDTDGDSPYKLVIEAHRDFDSTYEIKLMLDDLEDYLPQEMLDELNNEFYKFFEGFEE